MLRDEQYSDPASAWSPWLSVGLVADWSVLWSAVLSAASWHAWTNIQL